MEALSSIKISIPVIQLILAILLCTVSLLFGRQKLALLINYLFVFYWGFGVSFDNQAVLNPDISVWFTSFYIVFGCICTIFCLIGLLKRA